MTQEEYDEKIKIMHGLINCSPLLKNAVSNLDVEDIWQLQEDLFKEYSRLKKELQEEKMTDDKLITGMNLKDTNEANYEKSQSLDDGGHTIDLYMKEGEDRKFKITVHNLDEKMFDTMLQRILKND